jgi:hypothetical protein
MSLIDNFAQIKMYVRAYYVAGTHLIMEKVLEKMYDCMKSNKSTFDVLYDTSVHDEIVDIIMGAWPEYLSASFSPLSESLAKEYVLMGEMNVQLNNAVDYHHMAFFGETIHDDVHGCDGQCTHTVRKTFGSWCMCCRLKQQIPARMMKKIRGADRDFLKTFNPVKGGVKIVLKKEGQMNCRIQIVMNSRCHNPKLADMLANVTGYTDTLSVQDVSVTLMDRHIKYMEEQKRLALESLGLAF